MRHIGGKGTAGQSYLQTAEGDEGLAYGGIGLHRLSNVASSRFKLAHQYSRSSIHSQAVRGVDRLRLRGRRRLGMNERLGGALSDDC